MGQVKFTKNGENNSAQIGEIKSIRFGENNIDIIISPFLVLNLTYQSIISDPVAPLTVMICR